jgi:hypothetical protein
MPLILVVALTFVPLVIYITLFLKVEYKEMSESFVPKQCLNLHSPYDTDLYVTGNISSGGALTTNSTNITGNLSVSGQVTSTKVVTSNVTVNGNMFITDSIYTGNLEVWRTAVVTGNLVVGDDLYLFGNIIPNNETLYVNGNLATTNDMSVEGFLKSSSGTTYTSNDFSVQGNITATGSITGDLLGFKVYKRGDWGISDTDGSILQSTSIDTGNTWNSYDTAGAWNSTLGLYEIPKAGYWTFSFGARPKDQFINALKPLLFDTEAKFMVNDADNCVWITQENASPYRGFGSYTTTIYCDQSDWIYVRPFSSNNWLYCEMSGQYVGTA